MRKIGKKSASPRPRSSAKGAPAGLTPAEAYEYYLAEAQAIPEAEIVVCRGDLPLALHNVQLGIASVLPANSDFKIRSRSPTLFGCNLHKTADSDGI